MPVVTIIVINNNNTWQVRMSVYACASAGVGAMIYRFHCPMLRGSAFSLLRFSSVQPAPSRCTLLTYTMVFSIVDFYTHVHIYIYIYYFYTYTIYKIHKHALRILCVYQFGSRIHGAGARFGHKPWYGK